MRTAYLAHFVLTNAYKVIHCLGEANSLGAIRGRDTIRILDLGSGPGTASLAASLYLAQHYPRARAEITAIEQNAGAVRIAEALFKKLEASRHVFVPKIEKITPGSIRKTGGYFDIAVAANVMGEIESEDKQFAICKAIMESLGPSGVFIIIDPALRATTRPLMKLRNRILSEKIARVISPCLHGEPCPMFCAGERDWCHFYIEWKRPDLIRRMDELVGTNHEHLKMAYMIFTPLGKGGKKTGQWRAVSSPLVTKGKIELVLCGACGTLKKIMRQDKDRSESNADFDKVKRGDLVACAAEKIGKEDKFEIARKWNCEFCA